MTTASRNRAPLAITFAIQAFSVAAMAAIGLSQMSASHALVEQQMGRMLARLTAASQTRAAVAGVPQVAPGPQAVQVAQPAQPAQGAVPVSAAPAVVALVATR